MFRYFNHPEQFCFNTIKLKLLISLSRNIPSQYKRDLKARLIHFRKINSFENAKHIFAHLIFFHSYDLFTTSILSIIQKNARSLELMIRALLENYTITEYIEKYPEKIKEIFLNESVFNEAMKWNKSYDKRLFDLYNKILSKQAHPTPTRLLSGIDFINFLTPKQNANMMEFLSISPEERKKRFDEFFEKDQKPSPGIAFSPHQKIENVEQRISDLIYLLDMIRTNLDQIENLCPDYKIDSELWKKIIKKYKKI